MDILKTLEAAVKQELGKQMAFHTELLEKPYKEHTNPVMLKARLDYREHIAGEDKTFYITIGRVQSLMLMLSLVQGAERHDNVRKFIQRMSNDCITEIK